MEGIVVVIWLEEERERLKSLRLSRRLEEAIRELELREFGNLRG